MKAMFGHKGRQQVTVIIAAVSIATFACKSAQKSRFAEAPGSDQKIPYCSAKVSQKSQAEFDWENGASCRVAPECAYKSSDKDGDGWGWENNLSCRITDNSSAEPAPGETTPDGLMVFDTTYYPYGLESYFTTACGDANNHGGMYFAVTENSPLWPKTCELDSWAECKDEDCLGKWDRMPGDVKKEENGRKLVREPRCDVPCGKKVQISNMDRTIKTTAVIYDACPSQHWNNRFKEVTLGKNPCAKGLMHLDLGCRYISISMVVK